MKKYLFLAALVGVAFTSCVRNEEFAPKTQKEISFEVANYVQSTRVGAFDKTQSFGAYVWHNDGTTLTLMNDAAATVSYKGASNSWEPTPALYWPTTGSVDCQAYYPTTPQPTMDATGLTLTYPTYTVLNAAEDAPAEPAHDVKYADRAHRYTANESSYDGFTGIPTLFNHALAKLNFKVALNDTEELADVVWTAKVTQITVEGVYDTGKLVLTTTVPTGTEKAQSLWTLPSPAIWTKVGDTQAVARNWVETVSLTETDNGVNAKTFDAGETYYVLPQAIEDNVQKGTIKYSLTQSVGGVSTTTDHTKSFNFYGKLLDNWEMNKNITYTLTIVPHTNKILFAPAVTDWATDATGGAQIN